MNNPSFNTLFITRPLPYPPIGGVAIRNWQNINIMLKWGSVGVVSIQSNQAKDKLYYPPGVTFWKNYLFTEIFQGRSLWQKIQNRLWWLKLRSHPQTNKLYSDRIVRELDEILTQFQPHLVILEELWFYPYFDKLKNHQCNFIYDAHNVETPLRQKIDPRLSGLKSKIKSSVLLTKLKAIERTFVRQVDQVWVCSQNDADLMGQLYGQKLPIQVVPNGINVSDYDTVRLGKCPLPEQLRPIPWTIVFTATFSYEPNSVAAQLLIEQIYPKLKKLYPECLLLLVGRNPTKHMKETAKNDPGIIVTGKVPDVRPYLAAASVVVVPLLEGGGTRLKILEAFAAGLPVVSTSKGAEGIKAQDEEHLLIRDEIEDIVTGITELWSNSSLTQRLTDSAYELVKAEYSWQAVAYKIEKIIKPSMILHIN
ncbi:MAG: glycosyltransferase family 4 protein [Xenococcus sp. (in: cyanobacteria)]